MNRVIVLTLESEPAECCVGCLLHTVEEGCMIAGKGIVDCGKVDEETAVRWKLRTVEEKAGVE